MTSDQRRADQSTSGVSVRGLTKRFGPHVAVDDVSLEVPPGSVLAVLGPNGAGKTTTISCLTTLLRPYAGTVLVGGADVVTDPGEARRRLAVTSQQAAVDEQLTGRENLVLFARLRRLSRSESVRRAETLLERFALAEAADQLVKTYSGGMRRRLDLAASLVVEPQVLFLDEPTTGLDPRSRQDLWDTVRSLRSTGMTIVLTTQYLEEADQLADRLVVIDRGRIIAEGTADELKAQVGGARCDVQPAEAGDLDAAAVALAGMGDAVLEHDAGRLSIPAADGPATVAEALRRLDAAGVALADISLRRPSLDDVFFALTGHAAVDADADPSPGDEAEVAA